MIREWRLVKSLNNLYEVSNFGEVRSVKRIIRYIKQEWLEINHLKC